MGDVANLQDHKLKLNNDGGLAIATGKSRHEKTWKNKTMLWSALVAKLKTPTITQETYAEYKKSGKAEQDRIKDVGGFVGGHLKQGRRKADSVEARQILTLDLDFAQYDFFDALSIFADYACCLYSTHKHSKDTPRYRLLIPLDREVTPDEYEAIARMIANDYGIDMFDDTTYQPSRLMYWPSVSSDGEYFFDFIDLPFLSADSVLARYPEWTDVSYWPESSRASVNRKKLADKQGDPLEKPGVIGAFCRTYSVTEAIAKFIPDAYVQCTKSDRYTYTGGSTAAGLVIYEDDKFAYSNHGTDPASGKLCNAFDLVRIHKFHELDNDMPPGAKVTDLPSYSAMIQYATKEPDVKIALGREKLDGAKTDFETIEDTEEDDDRWLASLEYDDKGGIRNTIDNIRIILANDPNLKGITGYNEFNFKLTVLKPTPWRTPTAKDNTWVDVDDSGLRHYMENTYGITSPAKIDDALELTQIHNTFHPVRDYLNSLQWDGIERLDTLFIDYLGAEDSDYTRCVTRKMLVAAVARIFKPGCKYDNMLVLIGPQGVGKSYMLSLLGKEWFSDSLTSVQGKESYECLHGNWIIEMAELTAAKKAEIEAVKHYISKQEDIYRAAYAKRTKEYPRQCVFFGTTNDSNFLRDRTGNRRFWPVETDQIIVQKDIYTELEGEVDQIWAEAKYRYEQGEALYLDVAMNEKAIAKQAEHTEPDSRQGLVEEYLEMRLPENWATMDIYQRRRYIAGDDDLQSKANAINVRSRVCALEVWQELFEKDAASFNKLTAREINAILESIPGWKKADSPVRFGAMYGTQRGYVRV